MNEWISLAQQVCTATQTYLDAVRAETAHLVAPSGKPESALIEQHQRQVHGLAWIGTTIASLEAVADWAARAEKNGRFSEINELTLKAVSYTHLTLPTIQL